MEVTGRIKVIEETKEVTASFKKRELVVTTDEQYPQHILIEFAQDKCSVLDSYKVGEAIKVSINLRGREWVDPQGVVKYFNQIQGWKIEKTEAKQPQGSAVDAYQEKQSEGSGVVEDDLPF